MTKPTAREIAANIVKTGFLLGVTTTAIDFFISRSNFNESLCYGIAVGVGATSYFATGAFLAPDEEYIDDRTETNN